MIVEPEPDWALFSTPARVTLDAKLHTAHIIGDNCLAERKAHVCFASGESSMHFNGVRSACRLSHDPAHERWAFWKALMRCCS